MSAANASATGAASYLGLGQDPSMSLLTPNEISRLAPFDKSASQLWNHIQTLAWRVHHSTEPDLAREFHHLVLAVCNFKANIKVYPPSPVDDVPSHPIAKDSLLISLAEGRTLQLHVDDPASWKKIAEAVPGLGVPRTSTLLAALWPEQHVIIDWKALAAACALVGSAHGWHRTPVEDPDRSDAVAKSWPNYSWYRSVVCEEAGAHGVPLKSVERALYRLASGISPKSERTWAEYAQCIAQIRRE